MSAVAEEFDLPVPHETVAAPSVMIRYEDGRFECRFLSVTIPEPRRWSFDSGPVSFLASWTPEDQVLDSFTGCDSGNHKRGSAAYSCSGRAKGEVNAHFATVSLGTPPSNSYCKECRILYLGIRRLTRQGPLTALLTQLLPPVLRSSPSPRRPPYRGE